jgi:hypothetical protein
MKSKQSMGYERFGPTMGVLACDMLQEHELMVLMFARLQESIGIMAEAFKSRGLWTGDDPTAFSHAVHADDRKLLSYAAQAKKDYLACARLSGVVTGLES